MSNTYIITFYAIVALLIIASFTVGYTLARRMFPHTKSQNHGNANE